MTTQNFLQALINCSLTPNRKEYWLDQIANGELNEQKFHQLQTEVHDSLYILDQRLEQIETSLSQERQDLFELEQNVANYLSDQAQQIKAEATRRLNDFKQKAAAIEAQIIKKIEKQKASNEKGAIAKLKKRFQKDS